MCNDMIDSAPRLCARSSVNRPGLNIAVANISGLWSSAHPHCSHHFLGHDAGTSDNSWEVGGIFLPEGFCSSPMFPHQQSEPFPYSRESLPGEPPSLEQSFDLPVPTQFIYKRYYSQGFASGVEI